MRYITRSGLDAIISTGPEHLAMLALAVRDFGVDISNIVQRPTPFGRLGKQRKPTIFLIGDDTDISHGPSGFHRPSLRRAIEMSSAFVVISCEPLPNAYEFAASAAVVDRQHAMIVETRPENEAAWLTLIRDIVPGRPLLLATVRSGAIQ